MIGLDDMQNLELNITHQFDVSAERLWRALRDTELLSSLMSACKRIDDCGQGHYIAQFELPLARLIKAQFIGRFSLSDESPFDRYRIDGAAEHKRFGSTSMGADVVIDEHHSLSSTLHCSASLQLPELLITLAGNRIDVMAQRHLAQFFDRLNHEICEPTRRTTR
ncbi:SRPBCC domain-containing protein [Gammaproteobacteria bacterium]|nr:SRPBCC domain-containing protein [Gammaproteobacteria bacterium]